MRKAIVSSTTFLGTKGVAVAIEDSDEAEDVLTFITSLLSTKFDNRRYTFIDFSFGNYIGVFIVPPINMLDLLMGDLREQTAAILASLDFDVDDLGNECENTDLF